MPPGPILTEGVRQRLSLVAPSNLRVIAEVRQPLKNWADEVLPTLRAGTLEEFIEEPLHVVHFSEEVGNVVKV